MKELNVDKRIITLILKHTLQIISESEQQELDLWRQADARHEAVFEYLSELENLEKEYRFRKEIDAEQSLERIKEKLWNEEKETKEVPLRAHRFTTYLYRAAAIIVLLIVGGAYWYHREYTRVTPPEISQEVQLAMEQSRERGVQAAEIITSGMPHQQVITDEERALYHVDEDFAEQLEEAKRITTYHNKEYWVTLPDGSLVHLNYDSRLIYPEKFGDRRDVILEGEAYFMVAHDKSRKFVVHTPQGDVTVHGTEFNVNTRNENDAVNIVLVKGSVGFTPAEGNETMLAPGHELSYGNHQLSIRPTDIAPYTAWNAGEFVFSDWTLERIMSVIARWYGLEIRFMSKDLGERKYSGSLSRYEDLKPTLETIEMVTGLDLNVNNQKLYINLNK
ncbi:MAG: FecR domain-containing protein [Prevotella sp.]|nr:FecR domain-containing protein [Prevotella sp.]